MIFRSVLATALAAPSPILAHEVFDPDTGGQIAHVHGAQAGMPLESLAAVTAVLALALLASLILILHKARV